MFYAEINDSVFDNVTTSQTHYTCAFCFCISALQQITYPSVLAVSSVFIEHTFKLSAKLEITSTFQQGPNK